MDEETREVLARFEAKDYVWLRENVGEHGQEIINFFVGAITRLDKDLTEMTNAYRTLKGVKSDSITFLAE